MIKSPTQTRMRLCPRLSLLTALLLMALVACGITIWQLWREVAPLRVEVRRLRDEMGVLSVEDETKIHAIQVSTDDSLTWKWRIWVPEGRPVYVRHLWGNVPRVGLPESRDSTTLPPGDQWVTLSIRYDASSKAWEGILRTRSTRLTSTIPEQNYFFVDDWISRSEGIGTTAQIEDDPNHPVILQRNRAVPRGASGDSLDQDATTPGFIIWLERE
jgi:hypothetical protein